MRIVLVTDRDLDDLLTIPDVAARARVHKHTVDRWIKDGKIDSVKIGGRRYVPRRSFLAFVNANIKPAS